MLSGGPLTEQQIRQAFERVLADVLAGGLVPIGVGLDSQTCDALGRVGADGSDEVIQAARDELERQIDGTHAKEFENEFLSAFKQ